MAISKKSFVNLDLQGNALVNPTIGANADMTKAGSFQYNSVDNRLEYYNGATIQTVANLNDLTGALDFQGGYDADTNTPNLTTPAPGAILKGYYWVVTVAGTFFGEDLAVGDSLFANVNDPASLADWTLVQGNVDLASESTPGITYLASAAQVATGTETGAYAVNPATLQDKINAQRYSIGISSGDWTVIGGDPANGYIATVTHNLNCYFPVIQLNDDDTGYAVEMATQYNTLNQTNIFSNFIPSGLIVATLIKAAL